MMGPVHFFHYPDMAGNRNLVPDRRRFDDRPDLLGFTADPVLFIFLENRVKLEGAGNPFPAESDDQAPVLGQLDMVDSDQVIQKNPVVLF